MPRAIFVVFVLVCVTMPVSRGATTHPVTTPWFNALGADDKLALVSAALSAREAALQNFSVELRQEAKAIDDDKKNTRFPPNQYLETAEDKDIQNGIKQWVLWRRSTVLKRKGIKLLIHDEEFTRDGKRKFEFWMNWDGSTRLQLNAPAEQKDWRGRIGDDEPTNFGALEYNTLLGLRAWRQPITVPQWLDKMAKEDKIKNVVAQDENGKVLILIHANPYGVSNRRYWLDPEKGYMPVRYDIRTEDAKHSYNWATYWVRESKNLGDVWVPTRIVGRSGIAGAPYGYDQYTFTISKFELNSVTDKDVAIAFPPGTTVLDDVKNVAFRVTQNGAHQPMPLYNPASGLITLHGEKVGEVLGNAKPPFHARSHRWWIVALLAGVVLIVGAAVMIWRKRLRAQPG